MAIWIQELRPTLRLALPIMLGQVSQMLMGIADSVMIGRVGTVELAAAAFTNAVFGVIFVGCIGLLQPGSVLVARAQGAGRPDEAGGWLRQARWLAWSGGLVVAGLMAGSLGFADRFGQPEEVVTAMGPYYLLIAASLIPAMLFQTDRQFAEAMGRPWAPLAIMIAGAGLNVVLNWMLIYGRLGAPELGLEGAGVATLLARVATVLALRVWLARAESFVVAIAAMRAARVTRVGAGEMLRLGLPMGAALFIEGAAFSGAAVMAGWLGTVPLAAHQIAISCAALTFMVPLGLSIALSMRTGEAVGAGRRERVRPMAWGATVLTCAAAAVTTTVFVLAGELVAGGFSRDPAVTGLAARALVIVGVFQLFDGLQVVFAGALRGLTDVKAPLAANFAAYWLLALPAGWWFGVRGGQGLEAIWVALAAGLAAATVLLGWRLWALTR